MFEIGEFLKAFEGHVIRELHTSELFFQKANPVKT